MVYISSHYTSYYIVAFWLLLKQSIRLTRQRFEPTVCNEQRFTEWESGRTKPPRLEIKLDLNYYFHLVQLRTASSPNTGTSAQLQKVKKKKKKKKKLSVGIFLLWVWPSFQSDIVEAEIVETTFVFPTLHCILVIFVSRSWSCYMTRRDIKSEKWDFSWISEIWLLKFAFLVE